MIFAEMDMANAYCLGCLRESIRACLESSPITPSDGIAETSEEALNRAARQLRSTLDPDFQDRVRDEAPAFLKQVVVDLLMAMDYGSGDDDTNGHMTRRLGDGGIDGTIREDRTAGVLTQANKSTRLPACRRPLPV